MVTYNPFMFGLRPFNVPLTDMVWFNDVPLFNNVPLLNMVWLLRDVPFVSESIVELMRGADC